MRGRINLIALLSVLTALQLGAAAWSKLVDTGCSSCQQVASLSPADTVFVFGGIGVCTLLAILSYFSRIRLVEYGMLTLALLSATFGSFLLALQLVFFTSICYFCLGATVSIYVMFVSIAGRFFLDVVRRYKEA